MAAPDTSQPTAWYRSLLPGLGLLRRYERSWLRGDVLAGITVAAYLVPQVMAYAGLAGLEPVVGLWAILPALALYAVLGSSRQLSVGPESTTRVDDRDGDRPAGRRRRRPVRRPGGDPRARRWRNRHRRVDPPTRVRLRPAVASDPGRVPVRRRHHHDCRAAGEGHRCPCGRRHPSRRGRRLRSQHRGRARAHARHGPGHPGLPPPRPAPVPPPARSATSGPTCQRGHRPVRPHGQRDRSRGRGARGAADTVPAFARLAHGITAARCRGLPRRLYRQRPRVAGVRGAQRVRNQSQPGTPRPRRRQRRREHVPRLSDQQQREPDGARGRRRQPYPTPLVGRPAVRGAGPDVPRPDPGELPASSTRGSRHDVDDYPTAKTIPGLVVYRYDSPLFFANAQDFRHRALLAIKEHEPVDWFVLNVEANVEVDITALDALEQLRDELTNRGIVVALARVKEDLRAELMAAGLEQRIGADLLFPTLPTAVEAYEKWRVQRTSTAAEDAADLSERRAPQA